MFKKITAVCSAILISMTMTVSAFADSPQSQSLDSILDSSSSSDSSSAGNSSSSSTDSTTDEKLNSMITQYVKDSSIPDYENDSHYDTKGNASIVKEKKIIHDSAQMQFISVTTKSGAVFYILIDYTAIKKGDVENSVYFLNKVDDYDLYQLTNDSDDETTPSAYEAQRSENAANNTDTSDSSKASPKKESKTQNNTTSPFKSSIILLAVFGVMSVIAVVVIRFVKKKNKGGNSVADDEIDFDDSSSEE